MRMDVIEQETMCLIVTGEGPKSQQRCDVESGNQ